MRLYVLVKRLLVIVAIYFAFIVSASFLFAADNAARFAGDITLNKDTKLNNSGIQFSDGTYQNSACQWSFDAFNAGTIFYNVPSNKVGIGTPSPSTELDVNGTVKATSFSGDGSGILNVTASSVAAGAIGNTQISGPISASNLDLSGVQKKYGKTAVVAVSGGDFTDPVTAMALLGTWCGTPSYTNSCLLKIMPGTYNIEFTSLTMESYVDIEGSGENVTIISNGNIFGANNAELRFLKVTRNSSSTNEVTGIENLASSPTISNVTVALSGNWFRAYGITNSNSSPILKNVKISVNGGTNVTIGINNVNSSPTLSNVSANVISLGGNSFGIYNNTNSSPSINYVDLYASGGNENYGIYSNNSTPIINYVSATASGGSFSYGVYNFASAPIMKNVAASAINGTISNYGIYNFASTGTYTLGIDQSIFTGSTNSIFNDAHYTLKIGGSKLSGPTNNVGTYVYMSSYNDSNTLLNDTKVSGNLVASGFLGAGTLNPTRNLHIAHTDAVEFNMEVANGLPNSKTWNMMVSGNPSTAADFKFRTLNDTGLSAVDIFTLLSNGNAILKGNLTAPSDIRLKTNISTLENSLNKLQNLRGVRYVMKDDPTQAVNIGVIAQELEQQFPELVLTDDMGMKSVAYSNLTAVLIEAVKDVKKQKDSELNVLMSENEALKVRLDRLERLLGY